ncbi:hypothetical protein THAOC_00625 [Thalassiosira oceanica]|uniref:Uncharacterized protein n=1 Tax=Thalassiosira oceanica TaxID=159749 RepID=K0TJZ2_THAOC|nr:hypothetical protein THAOC_00625 [Thalassiosira oceanica]|eukprot:EJK77539.1 hypothetical protein THAOC_00625 [Thalassiosira oceanica]
MRVSRAILLLGYCSTTASAIEATFTPNPNDEVKNGGDGGPLPVSFAQRKQLLELEAAIVNSQDPQGTLNHVAQQNGLAPDDLVGMLNRNRKDLESSGQLDGMVEEVNAGLQTQQASGGVGGLPIRKLLNLIVGVFMAIVRASTKQISKNPRSSLLVALAMGSVLYGMHNAPRNGIVVPFSSAHTTVLEPPVSYLQRYMLGSFGDGWESSLPSPPKKMGSKSKKRTAIGAIGMTRFLQVDSDVEEDEMNINSDRGVDGFSLVTSAHTMISIDPDDEGVLECVQDSVSTTFTDRRFSEYLDSSKLKFRSISDSITHGEEGGVLAMNLLGGFGRYGVQPLCVSYEDDESEENLRCIAYHTLRGGHFDGEIRFEAVREESGIRVSVVLAIPGGGREPSQRLAESMVSSFTQSISESISIQMKQLEARRRQSKTFRARASGKASHKRHLKHEQTKLQEEMAADRKRKWKRNNPDAGHYRPSGHRMRSPQGSPRHC